MAGPSLVPRTAVKSAPRVLFLAPFEPWCRENGSSVVIADLLAGLASVAAADILPVFVRNPPPGASRRKAAALEGTTLGIEPLPKWFSVPAAVLTGRSPWWEMRFNDRGVARRIAEHARRSGFAPSLIHVEHLVLVDIGACLAREFDVPLVYRAHNIESQLWTRRLGDRGPLVAAFLRHLERRELAAVQRCDLTLCISEVDRAWVQGRAPHARVDVLPVGLTLDRFRQVAAEATVTNQICFVGGLEWAPNEAGLRWFVDEVFPRVIAAEPDARLAVLARGATERPWLVDHPHITVMPGDTDAATLFASSRVSIAPLLDGGGVRVKILESLAAGCPVVATPIGGEGLVLRGLTHTDDPADYAAACLTRLQTEGTESRAVAQASVLSHHEAAVVASKIIGFWSGLVPGVRERPARLI